MVPESFIIPGLRDNYCFLNGKKEASHCCLYSEIPLVLAISLISLNRLAYGRYRFQVFCGTQRMRQFVSGERKLP